MSHFVATRNDRLLVCRRGLPCASRSRVKSHQRSLRERRVTVPRVSSFRRRHRASGLDGLACAMRGGEETNQAQTLIPDQSADTTAGHMHCCQPTDARAAATHHDGPALLVRERRVGHISSQNESCQTAKGGSMGKGWGVRPRASCENQTSSHPRRTDS